MQGAQTLKLHSGHNVAVGIKTPGNPVCLVAIDVL